MSEGQFSERDHLPWSRFMMANVIAASLAFATERDGSADGYLAYLRERLGPAWKGLGAQGVEGAMLSMILTLEAMGCRITSTQTSPESSEIVVEHMPGTEMMEGMEERFDVKLDRERWLSLMEIDQATANGVYDILGAIADGAGIEFVREETAEGDVRLVLRAW